MKQFNGKAIKNPSGRAGEYSQWGCYFYVGCSNGCTYCYLKKGRLAKACGGDVPTLKKCFKDEKHALEIFEKELQQNLPELQKHGLFFSFTTDPMLGATMEMTMRAMQICAKNGIPVKILTKQSWWVDLWLEVVVKGNFQKAKNYLAFGFTLTGHDELEPNASTNAERIEAMRKLHKAGFKTWASIEPVIDFHSSFEMIDKTWDFCDLFKIGLESGKKYDKSELNNFVREILSYRARRWRRNLPMTCHIAKIYFKDSLLQQAGISREDLPENCVGRDYNMFNQ